MNEKKGTAVVNDRKLGKDNFYPFRLISDTEFKENLASLVSCQRILRKKRK
jgi:hypothetical protein